MHHSKLAIAWSTYFTKLRSRNGGLFLVVGLALLVLLYGVSQRYLAMSSLQNELPAEVTESATTTFSLPAALPVRLRIPSISLDVPFSEPLGVLTTGEVEVPDGYETVGWYKYSPAPGSLGPAVVLGHVDSYRGPAVFFSLGQLEPGDDIIVEREDGSEARFIVEKLERHNQEAFPTEAVYGKIDYPGLRLVTCSGIFDRANQRYSHNLIVYARLVSPE